MEVQQFEQAILKMAFETDAKITTASVAYYLGIPSRKANQLLESLLETGVLELDSDESGNLFYFVPNKGASPTPIAPLGDDHTSGWEQLERAADTAAARANPTPTVDHSAHFTASLDDQGHGSDDHLFSSQAFHPYPGADGRSAQGRYANSPPPGTDDDWFQPWHRSSSRSSRFDGLPDGVVSRLGRADARPDRCHSASVVLEQAASCEPKPLANQRPTITTCTDTQTHQGFSTHQEYSPFGFTAPRHTTALATMPHSSELALRPDDHIDQPEHQPGMALLLSLILCGTGQIYNGEVSKGIIMLILCFLLWFVFLGWVVHIWSIVDAVVVAERINRKSNAA